VREAVQQQQVRRRHHHKIMPGLDSHILLRALVDELARCGVQDACTSPGSRCTPIVLALARDERLRCWSHIDERCAGFFAVGAARASGRPVAVACTSGTAAANLAPAVIEAHEGGVPLIVLTADRPPELREVGAGQTIDQVKLYGDAVRWFFELDLPDAAPERVRFVRSLACRAVAAAAGHGPVARPGPVHLNVPLREPLVPGGPLPGEAGDGGRDGGVPWVKVERSAAASRTPRRHEFRRTVFVAGASGLDHGTGARLASFAERARVPLLADPLSGARRGPAAIAHYDLLLRSERLTAELRPEVICRLGELPTSKPLRAWLAGLRDVPQVAFSGDSTWPDPDSTLLDMTVTPLRDLLDRVEQDEVVPDRGDWLERWRVADSAAAGVVADELGSEALSEPLVAATLGAALPADATLFVASSMPVRDVEAFFPVRDDPPRVLANRGANGIDGTVSAAFGAAAALDGRVVLLIGDVALAHDVGGLLAASRLNLDLTVVLLNNDGGGIFHFLPVAGERDAFEEHVATPHGLEFAHAASLYGCGYETAADAGALRSAVERSLTVRGTTIIELRTDRRENLELHRRIAERVIAAT
jgi:2-succinyl-5-enolpyruvyl-6-hydroxy-3-cyclohexene-1-carboxylate synthase